MLQVASQHLILLKEFANLVRKPLDFRYACSLANANVPEETRVAQFYLMMKRFLPQLLFREYAERYPSLR